jgi:hypothetical protein
MAEPSTIAPSHPKLCTLIFPLTSASFAIGDRLQLSIKIKKILNKTYFLQQNSMKSGKFEFPYDC